MDPYEARNGVVYIYSVAYNDQGQSEAGWGTGWAIGKPGEPVQYIVTNGMWWRGHMHIPSSTPILPET